MDCYHAFADEVEEICRLVEYAHRATTPFNVAMGYQFLRVGMLIVFAAADNVIIYDSKETS
jgi:hypothetical protein